MKEEPFPGVGAWPHTASNHPGWWPLPPQSPHLLMGTGHLPGHLTVGTLPVEAAVSMIRHGPEASPLLREETTDQAFGSGARRAHTLDENSALFGVSQPVAPAAPPPCCVSSAAG